MLERLESFCYYDWGLYVDSQNSNKITGIRPNSFAASLGLKEGDIIQWVEKGIRSSSNNLKLTKVKRSADALFQCYLAIDQRVIPERNYIWINDGLFRIQVVRNGKKITFELKDKPERKLLVIPYGSQ